MDLILVTTILVAVMFLCWCNSHKRYEGLYTFNSRLSIDDQYFHDNLLDNATYFPNEYNHAYARSENIGIFNKTGMAKCLEQCPGQCMEYGVTGNAYCYV